MRVSSEVAEKGQLGGQSSGKSDQGRRSASRAGKLVLDVGKKPQFLSMGPFECPHVMAADFPQRDS